MRRCWLRCRVQRRSPQHHTDLLERPRLTAVGTTYSRLQSLTCPPTTINPPEASPTSLTLERRTLQFGPSGDQLSYVQNQVALLEATLASQSREAEQYIQNQRGQTHPVLLQQRVEFETQARGLRGVPHCGGMLFAYAFAPLDISPEGYFVRGRVM